MKRSRSYKSAGTLAVIVFMASVICLPVALAFGVDILPFESDGYKRAFSSIERRIKEAQAEVHA